MYLVVFSEIHDAYPYEQWLNSLGVAVQGKPSKVVVDSLALFGVSFLKPFYLVYKS